MQKTSKCNNAAKCPETCYITTKFSSDCMMSSVCVQKKEKIFFLIKMIEFLYYKAKQQKQTPRNPKCSNILKIISRIEIAYLMEQLFRTIYVRQVKN